MICNFRCLILYIFVLDEIVVYFSFYEQGLLTYVVCKYMANTQLKLWLCDLVDGWMQNSRRVPGPPSTQNATDIISIQERVCH